MIEHDGGLKILDFDRGVANRTHAVEHRGDLPNYTPEQLTRAGS
jgi:hypothetical protein